MVKYRRKVVLNNLKNSFPYYSNNEIESIEKKFYHYLCDLVIETVHGYSISRKSIKKRVIFKSTEIYDKLYDEGKSAIIVMGHHGNWEWVCRAAPVWLKNRLVVAYKPLKDKVFEKFMMKVRTEFGGQQLAMQDVARFINAQTEPFLLILTADQSPSDAKGCHWVKFLNQETAVLTGPAKLAKRYNLPIIYHDVKMKSKGHYECKPIVLLENPNSKEEIEISEIHVKELENQILIQPETWLWSHKRWKHKK